MISREDRRKLHNFLLIANRNPLDKLDHAIELCDIIFPYGCTPSVWEHPVLFESGIDIMRSHLLIRLIVTKKGYRAVGFQTDSLIKNLTEIVNKIQG